MREAFKAFTDKNEGFTHILDFNLNRKKNAIEKLLEQPLIALYDHKWLAISGEHINIHSILTSG